jgi:hypothetical protein
MEHQIIHEKPNRQVIISEVVALVDNVFLFHVSYLSARYLSIINLFTLN